MSLVEKRYAEALIKLFAERGQMDAYEQDLRRVMDIYQGMPEFKLALTNPLIGREVKKQIISGIFGGYIKNEILNFLMLLIDKERIKYLPGIFDQFVRMADEKRKVVNMEIISAAPLQEMQIERIKKKYGEITGASRIKAEVRVDKDLIGGVLVKIGDTVYDGTVKGMLERMRLELVKA